MPRRSAQFILLLFALTLGSGRLEAQSPNTSPARAARILVKPKPGQDLSEVHERFGGKRLRKFKSLADLEIIEVPHGKTAEALAARYQASGAVAYAEPDRQVHLALAPNDPYYANGSLWHLNNTGQSSGIADADVDAPEAWDTQNDASSVVVAVIDTGIRYTHQDLAPNLWHNPGETPGNGRDDEGNSYVDDVFGINTIAETGNPNDDYGHGSHVAGIIGGRAFNGVGIAGICWSVQLMACKFVDAQGNGWISDAIQCIDYARAKGAKVINFSWGDGGFNSQALYDAIASTRAAGIIFVTACGNLSENTDVQPDYPSCYNLDNIISVAATTRRDELAGFSSYGPNTVDLGAPGDQILSCWRSADNSYQSLSGTSMAAPMVAGACALVWARFPNDSYSQIIARILNNVDPLPALAGKCVTGGRLNLQKALAGAPSTPPPTVTVTASDPTATIGTSDHGAFTFTRDGDTSGVLTVQFQLGGTAVKWNDYRRPEGDMPESFTIPAGNNAAMMNIVAIANQTGADPQTVVITLSPNAAYTIGSPNSATLTITSATAPATPFTIRDVQVTASGITLTWESASGRSYRVLSRTNLALGDWITVGSTIVANGTNATWTGTVNAPENYFIVNRVN